VCVRAQMLNINGSGLIVGAKYGFLYKFSVSQVQGKACRLREFGKSGHMDRLVMAESQRRTKKR